ncbi:MAG: hypothetical protein U0T33_00895 [Bacteroidales bacterium]
MNNTSTRFIKYGEIKTDETDIYDDAWGFAGEFSDVLNFLGKTDTSAADLMGERLIGLLYSRNEI